ncbi:MAG: hypothetical protein M0P64_00360 [Candidatus Pacebacteria bacterium]|jgi:hypothetical protein|nr:hypothetical protein [Candidatus Paceibacterota bacterium]
MTKKRIIFTLVLLGVVFYMPWWAMVVVGLVGAFCFAPYYEVIALGALVDILYGAPTLSFKGALGFLVSIAIFFAGVYMKKIVR